MRGRAFLFLSSLAAAACADEGPTDAEVDSTIRAKCAKAAGCGLLGPGEDEATCRATRRDLYDAMDEDCRAPQWRLWQCIAQLPCQTLTMDRITDTECGDDYREVAKAGCVPDACLPTASP